MKQKKSNKEKHYAWLMGADMYLATAVILSKEMLKSYRSPIRCFNIEQQIDKKCGFTSANPDYEMLLPVVFNLKHGVELYLKSLIMQINSKLEYPLCHDLVELLNKLILEIKYKNEKDTKIALLDQDMRKVIEKYYFGTYAFTFTKAQSDKNNEAERFPEHQNYNCYKIGELYNLDMNTLLLNIEKDCIELQKQFRENILKKLTI